MNPLPNTPRARARHRSGLLGAALGVLALVTPLLVAGPGPAAAVIPGPATADRGAVRLLDLTPGAGNAQVELTSYSRGEQVELRSRGYGEVPAYEKLRPGVYTVTVSHPDGSWTVDSVVRINQATSYTIVAAGHGRSTDVEVLLDDLSDPPPGQARLRMIAAAPQAGGLDARVRNGPVLARDLEFGTTTGYATVREQAWRLRVRPHGDLEAATRDLALRAGRVYTLMVLQGPSGVRIVPVVDGGGTAERDR